MELWAGKKSCICVPLALGGNWDELIWLPHHALCGCPINGHPFVATYRSKLRKNHELMSIPLNYCGEYLKFSIILAHVSNKNSKENYESTSVGVGVCVCLCTCSRSFTPTEQQIGQTFPIRKPGEGGPWIARNWKSLDLADYSMTRPSADCGPGCSLKAPSCSCL